MTAAIHISGLHKRYGSVQALAGVDLEIDPGEFFGLLGPNGAGKTTLISVLAGLARADAGTAQVMGFDVVRDYRRARRALGVVPQELVIDPFFTVREMLEFQSGYFGIRDNRAWIEELMHHLDLTAKADTNMRQLSGGMKRRVLVAQALVHRPPVIVLDEPTAGVDVESRRALWHFIRGLNADGHTIVLTTHYLEEAQSLCGRVAMLKQGRIVALDSTHNLLARFSASYVRIKLVSGAFPDSLLARSRSADPDGYHTLELRSYADLEEVMHELRRRGLRVQEMELLQPDLEEVFLRLTGAGAGASVAVPGGDDGR
ncbi:MAG: ABC transporter ATP-binding protein [Betaproteobacteria bacterium]|nr:MAG: ABC transporter ATP-binding protein [Betaproteobacteria bacterium]